MVDPLIPPRHRVPSASLLIDKAAESLTAIKDTDGHTDAELGSILHRGSDQASRYRTGLAEMGMVAFLRACSAWNGRFANDVLGEIGMKLVPVDAESQCDRKFATMLARLKLMVAEALEDDGAIDPEELDGMQAVLDDVGRAVDARRGRSSTVARLRS